MNKEERLAECDKARFMLQWPGNHMTSVSVSSCATYELLVVFLKKKIWLTTLKLTSSFPGYRHVPLLTKRGDVICSAGLFVHCMLIDA